MEGTPDTHDIFGIKDIIYLIFEQFTLSCPINITGLYCWFGFGYVCKLFRVVQRQLLVKESQGSSSSTNNSNNSNNSELTKKISSTPYRLVQAVQLFYEHKKYPISIHADGCNPVIVESSRKLKDSSKVEWIVHPGEPASCNHLVVAPHYPSFFDFIRERSTHASRRKEDCFCLFHFRRGYFGFIIQCKIDSVSRKSNIKQSARLIEVCLTQSMRYYGHITLEANDNPDTYGAALYYLLKEFNKYQIFYISLSQKRKRVSVGYDGEGTQQNDERQFYFWRKSGSNFERQRIIQLVSNALQGEANKGADEEEEANKTTQEDHQLDHCCTLQ